MKNNTVLAIAGAVFLILALSVSAYSFSKCGAKTLLLGNGAFMAAVTGMCDK